MGDEAREHGPETLPPQTPCPDRGQDRAGVRDGKLRSLFPSPQRSFLSFP